MSEIYSIQGFLWKYKKGVTGGSWKKNWVYADNEVILQYGGNQRPLQNEVPKYSWKIVDCQIKTSNLRRFAFEVFEDGKEGSGESAIFAADDANSYRQWMKILFDNHAASEGTEISREEGNHSESRVDRYDDPEENPEEEQKKSVESRAPLTQQPIEKLTKEYFKKLKFRKVVLYDLFELIHDIDHKLFPHRVITFIAEELKKSIDSTISAAEFLSVWRRYQHLFTPNEEEFNQFYSIDTQEMLFENTSVDRGTENSQNSSIKPFPEWNLLLALSPHLNDAKLHPLFFRIHIPFVASDKSALEEKARNLLLGLYHSFLAGETNSTSGSANVPENISGYWYELQYLLLQRIEGTQEKIKLFYEENIYTNLAAKKKPFASNVADAASQKKTEGEGGEPGEVEGVITDALERKDESLKAPRKSVTQKLDEKTAELQALDEELVVTVSALSILWGQFYESSMKGAKVVIDEFTLPNHIKSIKPLNIKTPTVIDREEEASPELVFEKHGIHYELASSLQSLQPSRLGGGSDSSSSVSFYKQEKALLQQESFNHKYLQQEFKSFQHLNNSLQYLLLIERIKTRYFHFSSDDTLQRYAQSFVQKFTSIVDYNGFRVVSYVPNQRSANLSNAKSPGSSPVKAVNLPQAMFPTQSSLSGDHSRLLELLQKKLLVKLAPTLQFVAINLSAVPVFSAARRTSAAGGYSAHESSYSNAEIVYYLNCKHLLPADLTMIHTSEVYQKSFRPELLRAYYNQIPKEQQENLYLLSTAELVDIGSNNLQETDDEDDKKSGTLTPEKTSVTAPSEQNYSTPQFAHWKNACRYLYQDRIPQFARLLDSYEAMPIDSGSLSEVTHRHGINIRHLGIVYTLSHNVIVKQLLLSEIIARSVKTAYQLLTKSFLYSQKHLSMIAERRKKSTVHDHEELTELSQLSLQEIMIEVINLVFPTTIQRVSTLHAVSSAEKTDYQRSYRREQVFHFFELLLDIIHQKFGVKLTLSAQYSSANGVTSKEETVNAVDSAVTGGGNYIEDHPLGHYSLHCFQLLSAVSYHLQIRLKEYVYQVPQNNNPQSSSDLIVSPTSSAKSVVFLSTTLFHKIRDISLLDIIDQRVATIKSCASFSGESSGSVSAISFREEYSLFLSSMFPFYSYQHRSISVGGNSSPSTALFLRKVNEDIRAIAAWTAQTKTVSLTENLIDAFPNNSLFYGQYLREIFDVAWSYYLQARYDDAYAWIEEKFLQRSTYLHEYSLHNLPIYWLLMIIQYQHYQSYAQAMIDYDICYEIISKILPFSHPLLTVPMVVISELYLTHSSFSQSLRTGDEEVDHRALLTLRKESLQYAKFFYQLALSVWKYTINVEMHANAVSLGPSSSSPLGTPNASRTPAGDSVYLTKASQKTTVILPVIILQYKLASLHMELGEHSEAIPLLQSCTKVLETILNSLLHQNYVTSIFFSLSLGNRIRGNAEKEGEDEAVQAERFRAMRIVLRFLIPVIYRLSYNHFLLEEYDNALLFYQKCYQLFNKIVFNEAFQSKDSLTSSPNGSPSTPFLSLMSPFLYDILLSSLLSIYDIYLIKSEAELALEILLLIYRLFISKAYQARLPMSSFHHYQQILWKLFCKMNELTIITLPMNIQTLLESVSIEWNELMNMRVPVANSSTVTATLPGGNAAGGGPKTPSDLARQKKSNQKLFVMACKLIIEIMFRGEMMDYIVQLLQMIQKQIHEDNSQRYQYHNSGAAQLGLFEYNPHMDAMQLVKSIPTYAQAAAVSLLLKQPKEFAKYIL